MGFNTRVRLANQFGSAPFPLSRYQYRRNRSLGGTFGVIVGFHFVHRCRVGIYRGCSIWISNITTFLFFDILLSKGQACARLTLRVLMSWVISAVRWCTSSFCYSEIF
jgi:hypothetical protein